MILLKSLVDIKAGKNAQRVKDDKPIDPYNVLDFTEDYYHMQDASGMEDVIYYQNPAMDRVPAQATVISPQHRDKFINLSFATIHIKHGDLHPLYLCYLLNCSHKIERQFAKLTQGSVIARMSASVLQDIQLALPNMQTQERIGRTYAAVVHETYLERLQATNKMQGVIAFLRKMDEN